MYITFAKLPLSTNTLRVLNLSMVSIMTRGSSWGFLIPFTSRLKKTMSSFPMLWCFVIGWLTWRLFTYLWTAFLRDLCNPSTTGPPVIVLISPTMGLRLSQSSSAWSSMGFSFVLTNLIVFLNKLLEPSPLNQLIYLFSQILALVYVMSMVFMGAAILLWISSLWGWAQWLRLF